MQLQAVNPIEGQAPSRDGIQRRGGVMAPAELSGNPVTGAGPALAEVPQPKAPADPKLFRSASEIADASGSAGRQSIDSGRCGGLTPCIRDCLRAGERTAVGLRPVEHRVAHAST